MTFAMAPVVWALLIIPVLIMVQVVYYKDRSKKWAMFQPLSHWSRTIRLSGSGHYFWRKVLVLLAVALVVLAWMRPQYGEEHHTVSQTGRQVFFVVDTSLSMLAEDGAKTRLDLAKYHIQQLLPTLNGDRISIIPYASTSYTYLPLTTDRSAADLFLDDMFVGMIGSSGSNIMAALTVVDNAIQEQAQDASSIVVIFSDGEFKPGMDARSVSTLFSGQSVHGMVVGLGSVEGEPIPLRQIANQDYKKDSKGNIVISKRRDGSLQALADALNGSFIEGVSSPLVAETLYATMTNIQTKRLEEQQTITRVDRYHWVLLLAWLLLIFDYMIPTMHRKYARMIPVWLLVMSGGIMAAHPGVSAYTEGDYDGAKTQFEQTLAKQPDNGRAMYNLGNVYHQLGQYAHARQAYRDAMAMLPADQQSTALYNIGTTYLKENQPSRALEAYKAVLRQFPNHALAKQNMEWILRQPPQTPSQNPSSDDEKDDSPKENDSEDDASQNTNTGDTNPTPNVSELPTPNASEVSTPNVAPSPNKNQWQYLVDMAEKTARDNQKKAMSLDGDNW